MIKEPSQILKDVVKFNNPNVIADVKKKVDAVIKDLDKDPKYDPKPTLKSVSQTLGVVVNNTNVSNQKLNGLIKTINAEIANLKNISQNIQNISDNMIILNDKFDQMNSVSGKKSVLGTEEYENGRYFGELKEGKKDGKGVYYYNNGDRYEGNWKEGVREGKGIYYYSNGESYEGDFKNDKFNGKGVFSYKDGIREMGDYKDNVPTGVFARLHPDGKVEAIKC